MPCAHLDSIGSHKNLKTFPQLEVISISVFGSRPQSPPPLTYQKRTRKAETFLRKLTESSETGNDHMKAAWHCLPKHPEQRSAPQRTEQEKGEITGALPGARFTHLR